MNAYIVSSKETLEKIEWEDWSVQAGHRVWYMPVELVFAKTRGHARKLFTQYFDLEFVAPISIVKIQSSIEREPGIATYNDPLWPDCEMV